MKHFTFEKVAVRLAGAKAAAEFFGPIFAARESELLAVALCDEETNLVQLLTYPDKEAVVASQVGAILQQAARFDCPAILVAHNRPSGGPRPSKSDEAATRKLVMATEAQGITVLDHMIFADGEWCSFRRAGLI